MRELTRYARRVRSECEFSADDPLFPSLRRTEHYGRNMTPTSISHVVKDVIDSLRAKCPNLRSHPQGEGCDQCVVYSGTHKLRHTWTVNSLEDGVPESAVKSAGGWSSYAMVDRYKGTAAGRLALQEFTKVRNRRR